MCPPHCPASGGSGVPQLEPLLFQASSAVLSPFSGLCPLTSAVSLSDPPASPLQGPLGNPGPGRSCGLSHQQCREKDWGQRGEAWDSGQGENTGVRAELPQPHSCIWGRHCSREFGAWTSEEPTALPRGITLWGGSRTQRVWCGRGRGRCVVPTEPWALTGRSSRGAASEPLLMGLVCRRALGVNKLHS